MEDKGERSGFTVVSAAGTSNIKLVSKFVSINYICSSQFRFTQNHTKCLCSFSPCCNIHKSLMSNIHSKPDSQTHLYLQDAIKPLSLFLSLNSSLFKQSKLVYVCDCVYIYQVNNTHNTNTFTYMIILMFYAQTCVGKADTHMPYTRLHSHTDWHLLHLQESQWIHKFK